MITERISMFVVLMFIISGARNKLPAASDQRPGDCRSRFNFAGAAFQMEKKL